MQSVEADLPLSYSLRYIRKRVEETVACKFTGQCCPQAW